MSAFFVPKGNIDCAVRLFEKQKRRKPLELEVLGRELWWMNVEALEQRYGNTDEEKAEYLKRISAYRYRTGSMLMVREIQLIKATHCLQYQCSEGKVPEWPLFKEVQIAVSKAEEDFIASLHGYAAADWSIKEGNNA
jgi:hypothetical protein